MAKKDVVFFLILAFLIAALTFPLICNLKGYMPGFYSSDESYGVLWGSWRIKYSILHNLSTFKHIYLVAYPFGVDLYNSGYLSYIWLALHFLLSVITTPVLTWNLQILFNIFLSGSFTYILMVYLTKNRFAALFSSIIFAFCPYQFARIWQHLGLTYNQWIPLCFLSAIILKEKEKKVYFILFLLSLLLLFSFDYSIMYCGIVLLFTFFIYTFFYKWKIKISKPKDYLSTDFKYFKKIVLAGVIIFFILLPQFFSIFRIMLQSSSAGPAAFNPYHRPFDDLFNQSARPLSYLLPAVVHPVFGKFTEQFIGSSLYGISLTEHTLYLGWVPMILAFLAFKRWRKSRKELLRDRDDFYIGFFVLLAIVAWLFSQPPWWNIFGFKIYMPSFFMYKILPMFRAYCRFGIVVMLAVAVLAGFGLKFILEKFSSDKIKIVVTTLACSLVLFEFWNWPPYKVIDVSKVPAVYYWLKGQPGDFAVAEYPLDTQGPNEMYKFYQTAHEKKIINGTIPGTYANKVAQTISSLSDYRSAGILKWMGVKYVLVHREDYLKTELVAEIEELKKIPGNPGLKLIRSFPAQGCPRDNIMCVQNTGPIDIYEIVTEPIEPKT